MMKRIFDLAVSLILGILLMPILLIIMVGVYLSFGRPIFFKQLRPGLHGRPFLIYKFRTMRNEFDMNGHPLSDEERLTRFGRLLRSLSLDELPELLNVIRGDMSLVGPRPLLMEYLPLYNKIQARRHFVKPGITGWAQVNGRNAINWDEKFKLDNWYVDHQSFWLDVKIIGMTFKKVISREGISAEGVATMPKFTGNLDRQ